MSAALLDRMAQTLELQRAIWSKVVHVDLDDDIISDIGAKQITASIDVLLAEYRNSPPEISQETARELAQAMRDLVDDALVFHNENLNLIARAEAELKGGRQ